ncbi:MAG: RHS repeat-associated core domain-containing protein [Thermoanaerobaculaceae bacterium]|nr:RHS repeat-associated core domain-containing protein [Thermoanaerobaculaceae bacterium]
MINLKEAKMKNELEPYGVFLEPQSEEDTNLRYKYTGQERDAFTNYDYMHFRFYASSMGRFLKPDNLIPDITNPQNWNAYTYVKGNPVNFNDPSGHIRIVGQGIDEVDALLLYMEAKDYLSKSEVAKQVIEKMESLSGEKEVTVVVTSDVPDSDKFVPENEGWTNLIYWDPYAGLDISGTDNEKDKEGGTIQSPAITLVHESGHVVDFAENSREFISRTKTNDLKYDDLEEKKVITQIETKVAKQLNEPIRKSHKGERVKVEGPTSKMMKKKIKKVEVPDESSGNEKKR